LSAGQYLVFASVTTAAPTTTSACFLQLIQAGSAVTYSSTFAANSPAFYATESLTYSIAVGSATQALVLNVNSTSGQFDIVRSIMTAVRVA
jgi:hypothetical protein